MSGVLHRALFAVAVPLALHAVVLLVAVRGAGAALPPWALGLLFAIPALCGLLAFALLSPLRADLRAVQELVATEGPLGSAAIPAARAAESEVLLSALAQAYGTFRALERELDDARREVEEAEQLRVRFVAAMGHDLRGPLNAIVGFSDLLVMDGLDAVSAAQRPRVELVRRGAADLLVLLESILEWARAEAGQVTLEPSEVSLEDVAHEVASEARLRSADRGLFVQTAVASDLPVVRVDHERLVQALLGLLDHATRAPDQPRVTLSLWLAQDERGRKSVRIEVRDPRLAVREADQQSFFEAFRPSYAPSGKRVAGLGLGPALARTLIRAHGGEVWFASQPDTGTTFVVDLPLAHRPP
jgi:signal transduction histidine kinase